MKQDHADTTHETFWRQVLRWLVSDTPGPVELATPRQVLADETRVPLRAEVRDKEYRPVPDAHIEARIVGPGGEAAAVEFTPKTGEAGVFTADATAVPVRTYLIDVVAVRREDGTAENFRTEQNRELLERLSEQTGGRYYRPSEASKLAREIEYSEAGIAVREVRDLWSMPALLILALAVRSAEWLLRRRWGSV
jgi:hypothetical protein